MLFDGLGRQATPGDVSTCPSCASALIAKCGPIVTWHWPHRVADCDAWSEPETEWHRAWKRFYLARGCRVEVPMGNHRAGIVLPGGVVVELQAGYLSADDIRAREDYYGLMVWIYQCSWGDRLHFGRSRLLVETRRKVDAGAPEDRVLGRGLRRALARVGRVRRV